MNQTKRISSTNKCHIYKLSIYSFITFSKTLKNISSFDQNRNLIIRKKNLTKVHEYSQLQIHLYDELMIPLDVKIVQ